MAADLDARRWTTGRMAQMDLAELLGSAVQRQVPLAPFTAMRVGGPADLLIVVEDVNELARAVGAARKCGVPWRVLGGGCNVLVVDEGVPGLVIVNRAASISIAGSTVRAESGAKLAGVARKTVESGLDGLAWASGLPGTVGGAVVGNAGAFDGDIAGTLSSAAVLEPDGRVAERETAWFSFTYRGSRLKTRGGGTSDATTQYVVLAATFRLETADEATLRARADEALAWRRAHHPAGATMGSTFKNPPDGYAGKLIERAGLKGYRVGGVAVSEQHANFLVNLGDATAGDVLTLIEYIQGEVERQFGVELDLEIEVLG